MLVYYHHFTHLGLRPPTSAMLLASFPLNSTRTPKVAVRCIVSVVSVRGPFRPLRHGAPVGQETGRLKQRSYRILPMFGDPFWRVEAVTFQG